MIIAATSRVTKLSISAKRESKKYVLTMCLILLVLVVGRAVNNTVFYAFAGISLAIFLFSSISHCFSLLLFLLPFSSILKTDVDGMSFFTILFFVVVLRMLVTRKTIHVHMLISVMLFAVYCLLLSGLDQMTTVITIVAGLLLLYSLRTIDIDAKIVITAFSLGIVGASVLALLKEMLPIVSVFVTDSMLRLDSTSYALRFAGLQGNPNYYTLDIVVILSAIVVMMYSKKAPPIFMAFLVVLSVFGMMSVSKSFLLSWILLFGIWVILSIKQGVGKFMKFLMISIVGIAVIYYFAYDYINTYLFRFMKDSDSSLGNITTGRIDIWIAYVNVIYNDLKILLWGNGLNTILENYKGTHNTFLESLFTLGIIGSGLFFVSLKSCIGRIVTKPVMWVPIIMLLFRMMAIGILTYDNLWLYLGVFVVLSKEVTKKEAS